MPLIVLTGLPSSGKSRRAAALKKLLEQRIKGAEEKTRTIGDRGVLKKDGASISNGAKSSFNKKSAKTNDAESEKLKTLDNGVDALGTILGLDALKLDASSTTTPSPTEPNEQANENTWTVEIINDESLGTNRAESYQSALLSLLPRIFDSHLTLLLLG